MYPDSFFQWLGYIAVVFGILGLVAVIAFSIESHFKRRDKEEELEKKRKEPRDEGTIQVALPFLFLTAFLVALGCFLYVRDYVGFAQFLWVLASGTAGAGCVLWIEK